MTDTVRPHRWLPHPWNSPGKNTGVCCHFLLQGIFPTQGSNPSLLHCLQILYHLSHQRSGFPFKYICLQILCFPYSTLLNALTFLDSVIWPQTYHNFIYNHCVSQPSNCHVQFEVLHVKPSASLLWGQTSGKEIYCFRKTGYHLTLILVLFPEFPSSQ